MIFDELVKRPGYIFKFAIYVLFVCFAGILYFSHIFDKQIDKSIKTIYSVLIFLYGCYRLARTWQDLQSDIRNDE